MTDAESPETSFYRLLIVRDVWLPGVQRWGKEYVGRKMNGEIFDTARRFASEFSALNNGPSEAESERRLAELYLHHSRATPWRIIRAKVTVHRRIRQGPPKEGDFSRRPDPMNIQQWASAVVKKPSPLS
jgi:hypothetical protein